MGIDFSEVLRRMVEMRASDVHLSPGFRPAMRVRGAIKPMEDFPELTPTDTREIVYSILNDAQRKDFENNLQLDFAYAVPGVARFRVNAFFQRGSISAAFRLIPYEILSLEELGLPKVLEEFCRKPRGFVLVTGPTGSGKSTTLASMIDLINRERDEHILTIEDPIEFVHRHQGCIVNQREVGADTKSFASALKYALRQDPDVVLIGEMRDLETIEAALTIAESGHLAFGPLHTNSAAETINRIIDVFPSNQQAQVRAQLSFVLEGVITQTLLPRKGGGRVCACEVLVCTPAVRACIRDDKVHQIYSIMQAGKKHGMQTLNDALYQLYIKGEVELEECLKRSSDPNELLRMVGEPVPAGGV